MQPESLRYSTSKYHCENNFTALHRLHIDSLHGYHVAGVPIYGWGINWTQSKVSKSCPCGLSRGIEGEVGGFVCFSVVRHQYARSRTFLGPYRLGFSKTLAGYAAKFLN